MSSVMIWLTITSSIQLVFAESTMRHRRIVGGTRVESRLVCPFQVSVRYEGQHVCGGSLIHSRFVLTAAHCAFNEDKLMKIEHFSVVFGDLNVYEKSNSTISRKIWKRHQHPRYFSPLIQNDIALLEFSEPLEVNSFIKPISLSEWTPKPGTICTILGWGLTNEEGRVLIATPNLMKTEVVLLPLEECYKLFSVLSFDNSKICGYSAKGCPNLGDSGGPLVCKGKLSGVISFGKMHHCVRAANCFTSTKYHSNWIQYIIAKSEYSLKYGDVFAFNIVDIFKFILESIKRISKL